MLLLLLLLLLGGDKVVKGGDKVVKGGDKVVKGGDKCRAAAKCIATGAKGIATGAKGIATLTDDKIKKVLFCFVLFCFVLFCCFLDCCILFWHWQCENLLEQQHALLQFAKIAVDSRHEWLNEGWNGVFQINNDAQRHLNHCFHRDGFK